MNHPLLSQLDELIVNLKGTPNAEEILQQINKKSEEAIYQIKAAKNGFINDPFSREGAAEVLKEHL